MKRLKYVLIALVLSIVVTACDSPPESGTVTGKDYAPSYITWNRQCVSFDKNGICNNWIMTPTVWPERWCLELRDDHDSKKTGCREVDETTFHDYEVGEHYPKER